MIRTPRLRLRSFADGDLGRLVQLLGDWEVARWLARVPHPYEVSDARFWVRYASEALAAGREFAFAVERSEDSGLIGAVGLRRHTADLAELGYWIGRPFWRQGYAREAADALVRHGFGRLGFLRIEASALPDNHGSQALLMALGFTPVGERPFAGKALRSWPVLLPHFALDRPIPS